MRLLLLGLLALFPLATTPATVPPARYLVPTACLPVADLPCPGGAVSKLSGDVNKKGICIWWWVVADSRVRRTTLCETWADMPNVPSRLLTIYRSADPLQTFNDSGKRFIIVPLTDPSMVGMPVPPPL